MRTNSKILLVVLWGLLFHLPVYSDTERTVLIDGMKYIVYYDEILDDYYAYVGSNNYSGNIEILPSIPYYDEYRVKHMVVDVVGINQWAFNNCNKLETIHIPPSIRNIHAGAFEGCTGLKGVYIDDLEHWCAIDFRYKDYANPLEFAHTLYLKGVRIEHLIIPHSVTELHNNFEYSDIKSVFIPNSIKTVDGFHYCKELTAIEIEDGVLGINGDAFYACSSLKQISIPKSLAGIGIAAFSGCSSLERVDITDIASWLNINFQYTNSSKYTNPLEFAHHLYLNGEEVTKLVIPETVTSLGYAMRGCTNLVSVTFPKTMNKLISGSFEGCTNINTIISYVDDPHKLNLNLDIKGSAALSRIKAFVPPGAGSAYRTSGLWSWLDVIEMGGDLSDMSDPITLTAKDKSRYYGDENPSLEYTADGSILSGSPILQCGANEESPVGAYDILVSRGTVSNSKVKFVKGKMTVEKAPLVISVGNYTRSVNEKNPSFTIIYDGFKNGETSNVLTRQPYVTCSATSSSKPGTYDIIVKGATAKNYEITFKCGTLTITEPQQPGDLSGDGVVDGTDLVQLTNLILQGNVQVKAADLNGDGVVDGTDYVLLVNKILGK